MQPNMINTTTTVEGIAPEETEAMQQYRELSEEHKKLVNLYVQTLLREQCTP